MLLGTCSCAVVWCVLCALSGFAAPGGRCCLAPVRVPWLWPAACLSGVPHGPAWCSAPRPVQSLSVLQLASPTLWCLSPPRGLAPRALLGGCAGHAEAGREPGSLCLPLPPAEAGTLGSLRVVPVRGPEMGLSLAGPSGVGLGLRALRWLACLDSVTDASGFPYRPSFDGQLGCCTGAVSCGRRHLSSRVGGRHARFPCVCAGARPSWPGRAGRPPGRVLVRLTFSFGRFVFLLCLAPSGLGLPRSWSFVFPPSPLLLCFFFSVSPLIFSLRPLCLLLSLVSSPGCPGPWRFVLFVLLAWRFLALCALSLSLCCLAVGRSPVVAPPPSLSLLLPFLVALRLFFFSLVCAPLFLAFRVFRPGVPQALALVFVCCARLSVLWVVFFFRPSVLPALSPFLCPLVGRWLLLPPPPSVSRGFRCFRSVPWFFFLLVRPRCLRLSLVSGPGCPGPWRCVLFVCPGLPLPGSPCALALFVSPAWPWAAPSWLLPPPPSPLLCLPVFVAPARCLGFVFFFFLCAPPLSPAFFGFWPRVPWASALCVVCFIGLPLLGSPCALASFVLFAWPLAAPWWLLPPPPLCVSRFSSLPLGAVCRVLCCAVCPWVQCCAALLRVVPPGDMLSYVVLLCCARLVPLLVAPHTSPPACMRCKPRRAQLRRPSPPAGSHREAQRAYSCSCSSLPCCPSTYNADHATVVRR